MRKIDILPALQREDCSRWWVGYRPAETTCELEVDEFPTGEYINPFGPMVYGSMEEQTGYSTFMPG